MSTWALIASHAAHRYSEWEITTSYFPRSDRQLRPYSWFADPASATDHIGVRVMISTSRSWSATDEASGSR
jgi:hypothetical protein